MDDELDEVAEAVALVADFGGDGFDLWAIGGVELSSAGVGKKFLRQGAGEVRLVLEEGFAEADDVGELFSGGELARSIDGFTAGVLGSPTADGIEVFEGEAGRVDGFVAAHASGAFAVFDEEVADGFRSADVGVQGGDVVGGRGGRGAEDVFEGPDAAGNGRGLYAVGGDGEYAAMAEEAGAAGIGEVDFAEEVAAYAGDRTFEAVEAGERLIEEGVAGVEEVVEAFVLVEEMAHQEARLGLHGVLEIVPVIGSEGVTIGGHVAEAAEVEPAIEEAFNEGARFGAREKSPGF